MPITTDTKVATGHDDRHLRALHGARQHVAAIGVGAEEVQLLEVRRLADRAPVHLVVGPRREERADEGEQHDGDEHEDRDQRRFVVHQAAYRVLRQRAALRGVLQRGSVVGEDDVLAGDASHQRYLTLGSSQA
jgi:hypothetical protein